MERRKKSALFLFIKDGKESRTGGTVKYYAQIHLQVWQNSVCTGAGKPALNYLVAEDREDKVQ